MSVHIVIDGYNLIRQSSLLRVIDLEDIQLGREALIDMLARYRRMKPHKITVVFDGFDAPRFSGNNSRNKGIEVKFSRNRESADTVIKRISTTEKQRAMIVTSDREILDFVEAQGSAVIDSPGFEFRIASVLFTDEAGPDESGFDNESGWIPTTKKKGPSKRPSRRKRKHMAKIRKL